MQFTKLAAFLAAAGTALATGTYNPPQYETVHLTMTGGPASYDVYIPADGNEYKTYNDLSISIIKTNGFDAYSRCHFVTDHPQTLVASYDSIDVGAPQPIRAVSCY